MMTTRDRLLADIEVFLRANGMTASSFGERAVSDRGLMTRLRRGLDVRTETADRIREFMATYQGETSCKRPRRRRSEPCRAA